MLTHEGIQEWMDENCLSLVQLNGSLEFMDSYDSEPFEKHNITNYNVELLKLKIELYINEPDESDYNHKSTGFEMYA
jgi:hypothetical protein